MKIISEREREFERYGKREKNIRKESESLDEVYAIIICHPPRFIQKSIFFQTSTIYTNII